MEVKIGPGWGWSRRGPKEDPDGISDLSPGGPAGTPEGGPEKRPGGNPDGVPEVRSDGGGPEGIQKGFE